jgi:hypothetical protein
VVWAKKNPKSYYYAQKRSWQRKIAEELGWTIQTKATQGKQGRTYEQCLDAAKHYKSLREWVEKNPSSYLRALRKGWQKKIATDLGLDLDQRRRTKRTFNECKEIAQKYKRLSDWSAKDSNSYQCAQRQRWLKRIAREVGWVPALKGIKKSALFTICLKALNEHGWEKWEDRDKVTWDLAQKYNLQDALMRKKPILQVIAKNMIVDGTRITLDVEGKGVFTADLITWGSLMASIGGCPNVGKATLLGDLIEFPNGTHIEVEDLVALAESQSTTTTF